MHRCRRLLIFISRSSPDSFVSTRELHHPGEVTKGGNKRARKPRLKEESGGFKHGWRCGLALLGYVSLGNTTQQTALHPAATLHSTQNRQTNRYTADTHEQTRHDVQRNKKHNLLTHTYPEPKVLPPSPFSLHLYLLIDPF